MWSTLLLHGSARLLLNGRARHATTALAVALFALGCSQGASPARGAKTNSPPPTPVSVVAAAPGKLSDHWTLSGEVRALARSELASGASGAITRVLVREGDTVRRGQLLLEVDPALARARLRVSEAARKKGAEQLKQAQREVKRFERLGRQSVSALELERAQSRAQSDAAQQLANAAAVAEALATLKRHRVLAPYAAVVSRRRVDPGTWVEPGDKVLDVVAVDQVEIVVDAAPRLLAAVNKGDSAKVLLGGTKTSLNAKVAGIVPALDPIARTARIRLTPSVQSGLRPGSVVSVSFLVHHVGTGVVVPRDAILKSALGLRVVRVVRGRAQPTDVQLVATSGDKALVESGALRVGDKVVTRGNERLKPDQPVEPSN